MESSDDALRPAPIGNHAYGRVAGDTPNTPRHLSRSRGQSVSTPKSHSPPPDPTSETSTFVLFRPDRPTHDNNDNNGEHDEGDETTGTTAEVHSHFGITPHPCAWVSEMPAKPRGRLRDLPFLLHRGGIEATPEHCVVEA